MAIQILYLISVIASICIYPYVHWYKGHDLNRGEAAAMICVSLVPILNIVIALALLSEIGVGFHPDTVILKGRKK